MSGAAEEQAKAGKKTQMCVLVSSSRLVVIIADLGKKMQKRQNDKS